MDASLSYVIVCETEILFGFSVLSSTQIVIKSFLSFSVPPGKTLLCCFEISNDPILLLVYLL